MNDPTVATVAALTVAAAPTGDALLQVFNDFGLMMAAMGGAGGLLHVLIFRRPWRSAFRLVAIGALMAFGVGLAGPALIENVIGIKLQTTEAGPQWSASIAFLIGVLQERIADKLRGVPDAPTK